MARIAGVTVPLFSLRTERSFGIGEIGDLPPFAEWISRAGISLVQVLPLGEIPGGVTSPYSALTAFGIDPIYVTVEDEEVLPPDELATVLGAEGRATLARLRASARIDYEGVRALKGRVLHAAFERFRERDVAPATERARSFFGFVEETEWLRDLALFRAIKDEHGGSPWWDWPPPIASRDARALADERARLDAEVQRHAWLQWIARLQWDRARAALRALRVEVMGDLPFVVGRDSADVWAHQGEFRDDACVGAPPDQFDEGGQEWGLPPYNWDAMRANGFAWHRRRARESGLLFDRFRIDHLVGFFRTYSRKRDRLRDEHGKLVPGTFEPEGEEAQREHGERVVGAMVEAAREVGAQLVGEDLGVIPNYVRPTLTRLGVPGYKVLIWEKDGAEFRDPARYPALSVACFGTHDTAPVSVWWESLAPQERAALERLPALAGRPGRTAELGEDVQRELLDLILGAGSDLVLLLVQEVLQVRDRINTPGTVGPWNWTWRLPVPVERLREKPAVAAALALVRGAVERSGRARA